MRMIYEGPYEAVTFPVTGQVVERGVPVEVPDDAVLGADWLPADLDSMTLAQLRDLADVMGVDVPKNAKKADLLDLLTPPDEGTDKEA